MLVLYYAIAIAIDIAIAIAIYYTMLLLLLYAIAIATVYYRGTSVQVAQWRQQFGCQGARPSPFLGVPRRAT